jgi:hypothetical protein
MRTWKESWKTSGTRTNSYSDPAQTFLLKIKMIKSYESNLAQYLRERYFL